jgi:hypothetical protein
MHAITEADITEPRPVRAGRPDIDTAEPPPARG